MCRCHPRNGRNSGAPTRIELHFANQGPHGVMANETSSMRKRHVWLWASRMPASARARHLRRKRHVWTAPSGKDFFIVSASGSGAVMYPACLRGAWTAGPEGVRGRAPRSSMRARGAMTFAECPDPVSDRFAVTSKLPLRSWTRVTRSTNSIRGVDAQSIHTLFIGQPCDSPPRGRLLVWLKQRALPCRHAGADDSSRP